MTSMATSAVASAATSAVASAPTSAVAWAQSSGVSGKQQIRTFLLLTSSLLISGNKNILSSGAEVRVCKCVGVQAPPVNFDAKQFFKPDIAEMDLGTKMIQQGKLAWLVGRLKDYGLETELGHKLFGVAGIQMSV